mgnify:CR=1 FL=1
MKRHFLFYLCLLACFDASAKIVIHAGYLIDGTNDAPMNEISIYIEQNRITQVITGYVDPEPDDEYIDLSGYTLNNRHKVLARRCAKTQILWLGFNNTLGLKNYDYLIADKNLINKKGEI